MASVRVKACAELEHDQEQHVDLRRCHLVLHECAERKAPEATSDRREHQDPTPVEHGAELALIQLEPVEGRDCHNYRIEDEKQHRRSDHRKIIRCHAVHPI